MHTESWKVIVDTLFFTESICDKHDLKDDAVVRPHVCVDCQRSFITAKALESHSRAAHGKRNAIREYVATAKCLCCGTDFVQRIRCLVHFSDRRRPRCRQWVLQHMPKLSSTTVTELDAVDSELRREAQRAGRTHVIARGCARNNDGKVVGRAAA